MLIDAFNEYYRAAFTPEQWAPSSRSWAPRHLGWTTRTWSGLSSMPCWTRWRQRWPPSHCPSCRWRSSRRDREDELPRELTADLPPGLIEAEADARRPGQAQLAALVPDARHVIAAESGHYIQLEQPALVIEAIRQVVEGVRHPNTWSDLVSCSAPSPYPAMTSVPVRPPKQTEGCS